MKVRETDLPGVLLIEPRVLGDSRGFFMETYHTGRYAEAGLDARFVQDNLSSSTRGVIRGLHFQHPHDQGKLLHVLAGEVFDVAVDIRVGSPHFGGWTGAVLSADNHHQLYVPPGFAHGFCTSSETVLFYYKCTDFYYPETEGAILWSDPDIGIEWPLDSPLLSPRDAEAPRLTDVARERLPAYRPRGRG